MHLCVQRANTYKEVDDLVCTLASCRDRFGMALLSRLSIKPRLCSVVGRIFSYGNPQRAVFTSFFFPRIIDAEYEGRPLLGQFVSYHDAHFVRQLVVSSADPRRAWGELRDSIYMVSPNSKLHDLLTSSSVFCSAPDLWPLALSSLFAAVQREDVDIVWQYLNAGCPADTVADGSTLLHLALASEATDCALVLIGYGADCNRPSRDGKLPLEYNVVARELHLLCSLLDHGADPNAHLETTSLVCSTIKYRRREQRFAEFPDLYEAACVLVLAGADLHARDATGRLHLEDEFPGGDEQIDAFVAENFPTLPGRGRMTKACRER